MWIKVRSMDAKTSFKMTGISKTSSIATLKNKILEKLKLDDENDETLKLYFAGKQLVDGHSLHDYSVGLNDTVQFILSREKLDCNHGDDNDKQKQGSDISEEDMDTSSALYKMHDLIDIQDYSSGAWYEGKINNVTRNDTGIAYDITYDNDDVSVTVPEKLIRPRAQHLVKCSKVEIGKLYMVNYNVDDPSERGYWYDVEITKKEKKKLWATIFIRETLLADMPLVFTDKIFTIEAPGSQLNSKVDDISHIEPRDLPPTCDKCLDNTRKKCKSCQCCVCGDRRDPEKQILCDECDQAYHLDCLDEPLDSIPTTDDWYCPECKLDTSQVVKAGEKLKKSAKKAKTPAAVKLSTRDWGRGMACAGRTSVNNMVPSDHIGPIPGVEVGMSWKFRVQVSESGCHRPPVAGIHGRESGGAFSLVLSGGYEDDVDEGEQFTYTGSGGRDLSGNRRCAAQSCDQTLTRMNMAIAVSCAVPVNANGAKAKNWKDGQAIRVIRNYKGRKHSEYAPEEGNRYDGIYKVAKYWQSEGKAGFMVWRFLLRRDDPVPAPWTEEGFKRIQKLGLTLKFPEGYVEPEKVVEKSAAKRKKRKHNSKDEDNENLENLEDQKENITVIKSPKRKKINFKFDIDSQLKSLIAKDLINAKIWNETLKMEFDNYHNFLRHIEEEFSCICCQDVVLHPLIIQCKHIICKDCLRRSFKAEVYTCPTCRLDIGKDYKSDVNQQLSEVLMKIFPNYDNR